MRLLKTLLIAVVCVSFGMATGCGTDSDTKENPKVENNQDASVEDDKDAGVGTDIKESSEDVVVKTDAEGSSDDVDVKTDAEGSSDDGGGTNDTPLTAEAYIDDVLTAIAARDCAIVFSCPEKESLSAVKHFGRFADQARCAEETAKQMKEGGGVEREELLASISAGRTTFDVEKAESCLEGLTAQVAAACDSAGDRDDAACLEGVFVATIAVGGACATSAECVDGYCSVADDGTCPGTCIANLPKADFGESCEEASCKQGLTCASNSSNEYTCKVVEHAGLGASCDNATLRCKPELECGASRSCTKPVYQEKDTECGDASHCKPGLACVGEIKDIFVGLEGTCQPVGQIGNACLAPTQCSFGLHCTSTDTDEPGECVALKTVGEVCDHVNSNAHWCEDHLRCLKDPTKNESTCHDDGVTPEACVIAGE